MLGLGSLARVVGWALGGGGGGGVALPGMWVGVSFTALQFLVVVACVGLLPFPQFLGEVLSVFL